MALGGAVENIQLMCWCRDVPAGLSPTQGDMPKAMNAEISVVRLWGARTGQGPKRQARPQAEIDRAPEARGDFAAATATASQ
jgi:hypothetical protein